MNEANEVHASQSSYPDV